MKKILTVFDSLNNESVKNISIFYTDLDFVKKNLYDQCFFECSDILEDSESFEYGAGQFKLSGRLIKQRTAKITPTKIGQFVTLWKRDDIGKTRPHEESDKFDYFVINVKLKNHFGQFIFPKQKWSSEIGEREKVKQK